MKSIYSSPLGIFIANERKALGSTVVNFCRECGITVNTYYRMLGEKNNHCNLCKGNFLSV